MMERVLYLCYCVCMSSYNISTRDELYHMIKEYADNGDLDTCEAILTEVYGISVP